MRLDKFLCRSTDLSRKEVTAAIQAGDVSVNDEVITVERTQVHENNQVCLNGELLEARPARYIMLHKPADMICSNADELYPSVLHLIDVERAFDLHIAGRLDADTTGLVLVTDDGRWSFNIISPRYDCEKTYRVGLRDPIRGDEIDRFAAGLKLQGEEGLTRPAKLEVLAPNEVLLTITEGKFHQVKRMFKAVGNRVVALHRERIGGIQLDMPEGQWRYLTEEEIGQFSGNA